MEPDIKDPVVTIKPYAEPPVEDLNSLPIERLYSQISKLPLLIKEVMVVDQTILNHFHELKTTADIVLDQLEQEKQKILTEFDSILMPLAKEVLDDLLRDADQLKTHLDDGLSNFRKNNQKGLD